MNIPEVMKQRKNRKMNFIEKLHCGFYWFGECFSEWAWCMTDTEDNGREFFCYICSDYVAYEESVYYR